MSEEKPFTRQERMLFVAAGGVYTAAFLAAGLVICLYQFVSMMWITMAIFVGMRQVDPSLGLTFGTPGSGAASIVASFWTMASVVWGIRYLQSRAPAADAFTPADVWPMLKRMVFVVTLNILWNWVAPPVIFMLVVFVARFVS